MKIDHSCIHKLWLLCYTACSATRTYGSYHFSIHSSVQLPFDLAYWVRFLEAPQYCIDQQTLPNSSFFPSTTEILLPLPNFSSKVTNYPPFVNVTFGIF